MVNRTRSEAAAGALLAAVFGFAWYPVKRLLRAIRDDDGAGAEADATER